MTEDIFSIRRSLFTIHKSPFEFLYQGQFAAIRKLDTVEAVGPDFMGKHGLIDLLKPESLEEFGLVGQRKDSLDP